MLGVTPTGFLAGFLAALTSHLGKALAQLAGVPLAIVPGRGPPFNPDRPLEISPTFDPSHGGFH
jgi:hypothetical protein